MDGADKVYCAVDTVDIGLAARLIDGVRGAVGGIKLGLEFFTAHGPDLVRRLVGRQTPLFLDLKLHDIPNTVAGAVRAVAPLAPTLLTIHSGGGPAMMRAARQAAEEAAAQFGVARPRLLAVTVLTSLDRGDLDAVGVAGEPLPQVRRLAALAQKNGMDGVICSPLEIEALRADCGRDFLLVVPGIRPAGSAVGDQKRVMTPGEAMAKGADYLVIGRPITEAASPRGAAEAIAAEIAATVRTPRRAVG
ncbi:MAG: orotidine-5'-phosphate decarboxylase [Reyranellaceae bacterium]